MVQEDVREARGDHTALRGAFGRVAQEAIFQDSCFQPLINHPSDDTVRDSLVKKVSKLRVRYRVEVFLDVDIDHPAQSLTHAGRTQRLQRLMRRASGPEPE